MKESKIEASDDTTKINSRTFTEVLQGTSAPNSELTDYEKIITNKYHPLTVDSDFEGTAIVLDALIYFEKDIDEFYANQDIFMAQAKKESILNVEVEVEYEVKIDTYEKDRNTKQQKRKERTRQNKGKNNWI